MPSHRSNFVDSIPSALGPGRLSNGMAVPPSPISILPQSGDQVVSRAEGDNCEASSCGMTAICHSLGQIMSVHYGHTMWFKATWTIGAWDAIPNHVLRRIYFHVRHSRRVAGL